MKRIFKILGLTLLVIIVALGAFFWSVLGRLKSVPAEQVVNQVHFVPSGMSTVAIVPTGPGEVLLVDAGNDASGAAILAELTKMGLTPDAVTAILFTHGHSDHIAAAGLFAKAQLMSLAPEVDLIAGRMGTRGPVAQFLPVAPTGLKITRTLGDRETLTIGQTAVKVFATPGHTDGSASYLVNGVLFMGDSAVSTTAGKFQSAIWMFSNDMQQNEASLTSLEKDLREGGDSVQAIAFAHSGLLQDGLAPLTAWVQEAGGD